MTIEHIPSGVKKGITVAALLAIAIGVFFAIGMFDPKEISMMEPADTTGAVPVAAPVDSVPFVPLPPTDVVQVGALDFYKDGQGQDEMFLVQKGEVRTRLLMDEQSFCNTGSGGVECMAMSSMYSTAFSGRRALIDGNKQGDAILIRKIRILDEGETPRVMPAGTVYIPWMQARNMILGCEVKSMMQSHTGEVYMTLKNGKQVVAIQHVIDDVFKVANESTAKCGDVGIGTE